ncbi:MAG: recombinase family protein [Pseudomonadota bacterium]|nr:recombinase family protein [Pseudomonadota bacterium]
MQSSVKRKTVAYCRVSTALQGSGLESQVRQVRVYCEQMGIKDVEIFTDENQSGAKQNRPALDRMMAAVKNNEVEQVIVPAFSRLARSTTRLLKALDEFKANNCSFISLSERLDTSTAAGKMAFTVLAAVSQLERELIIERVKVGLANARAKGKLIGRKKMRNSDMIRALRKKGLTYRSIADLCGCSHGSVHAEILAMKKEDAAKKLIEEQENLKKLQEEMQTNSLGVEIPAVANNLDTKDNDTNIEKI